MRLTQKNQIRFDEARFKLINKMLRNVKLHDEIKISKKELAQAKEKQDRIIEQLRNISNFFTFNFIVEKQNTKHSDLFLLIDEKNFTFDD